MHVYIADIHVAQSCCYGPAVLCRHISLQNWCLSVSWWTAPTPGQGDDTEPWWTTTTNGGRGTVYSTWLVNGISCFHTLPYQGFFQLFPQGGKMRLYGLLGGQVRICVQSMGGPGACSPREILFFDLLVNTIWWNLGLFFTSIIHHLLCHYSYYKRLNRFTCKIEIPEYPREGGGRPKPRGGQMPPPTPRKKPCYTK